MCQIFTSTCKVCPRLVFTYKPDCVIDNITRISQFVDNFPHTTNLQQIQSSLSHMFTHLQQTTLEIIVKLLMSNLPFATKFSSLFNYNTFIYQGFPYFAKMFSKLSATDLLHVGKVLLLCEPISPSHV